METQKESICFDFGKDEQKQIFFDKAKKCDIIHNNNSVFLHKILSVKNQTLLDYTLKKNETESQKNDLNTISELKKSNHKSASNRTLQRNKTSVSSTIKQNSLTNLLAEINFNSPQNTTSNIKTNIFSPRVASPKIIVNKNKNLGNIILKEKEKDKEKDKEKNKENENIYSNTYFNKDNTNRNKNKTENQNLNNEYFVNPEISFSNLYTSNYIRKPVVIKFNKGINPINITNSINSTSCNNYSAQKIDFSNTSQEKEENKESNYFKDRIKTDERIKPYNFYEKSQLKPELYRSFEDLERKSMEISRRRMKKNSSSKFQNFKKDTNLVEVKQSMDNFLQKFKSKKRLNNKKTQFKTNIISKNRSVKNITVIKSKDTSFNSFKTKDNDNENEKNNFIMNKENININHNLWQEERNYHYNKINENENNNDMNNENKENINENYNSININKNIKTLNFKNMYNKYNQKDINNKEKRNRNKNETKYYIKRKNMSINLIEDQKNENIYNISLNEYNNYSSNSLNYNHSFNSKKSFIRKKYGKKNNINKLFENYKKEFKNNRKENNRVNKSPVVNKKFIEDYKANDNLTLSVCQSQLFLTKNNSNINIGNKGNMSSAGRQIKVNKKSNSSHKKIPKKEKNNLPSILEEEEKIKNEIKNNLNIINAIENINNFIKLRNKNDLKETFNILIDYYNQIKTINYSTVMTNVSQNTALKYVRKIIPINNKFSRESIAKINKYNSRTNLAKKNYFNIEKQKLIILKRKEFGFFERYEHCIDIIDNLRKNLIKYSFKK